jgi:hypothetical protein
MYSVKTYSKVIDAFGTTPVTISFTDNKGVVLPCNYIKLFSAGGTESTSESFDVFLSGVIGVGWAGSGAVATIKSNIYPVTFPAGKNLYFDVIAGGAAVGSPVEDIFVGKTYTDATDIFSNFGFIDSIGDPIRTSLNSDNTISIINSILGTQDGFYLSGTALPLLGLTAGNYVGADAVAGTAPISNSSVSGTLAVKVTGQKPTILMLNGDKVTGCTVNRISGTANRVFMVSYGVLSPDSSLLSYGANLGS